MAAPGITLKAHDFAALLHRRTTWRPYIESASWLSNGHWAIRKDHVAAVGIEAVDPKTMSDERIERALFTPRVRAWTATEAVEETSPGVFARLFASGNQTAALARRYLAIIKADRPGVVLYARDQETSFRNARRPGDAWFVLMPMRRCKKDALVDVVASEPAVR